MAITLKNNFKAYKQDFKADTGLDADSNMALYINYVTARNSDYNMQIFNLVYSELKFLPDYIGTKVASAIKKY
jgi:hypothetical protein